jgi:hypothetical protein
VSQARDRGIELGEVLSRSRTRPDGVILSWEVTAPGNVLADGLVPFFIDWGETIHPALGAAQGALLLDLRAEHPDTDRTQRLLNGLGLELPVQKGAAPALIATIASPRGIVELR